jgi:hypothetical protein
MSSSGQRFAFSYGAFRLLLSVMGLGPAFSRIVVGPSDVVVVMGWGFRATIPRSSITRAYEDQVIGLGIGVHGFRGRWLVNGSMQGIVTIEIDPPGRARMMGLPVKVTKLQVSAEDPGGLVAVLGRP